MDKKITRSTIKSFIQKNKKDLYIKKISEFDGQIDGSRTLKNDFEKITEGEFGDKTFGINGVWFVGNGRDYFERYEDANFLGYEISNSCATFILALKIEL